MISYEEIEKRHSEIRNRTNESLEGMADASKKMNELQRFAKEAPQFLQNLDDEFESITKLNSVDTAFLFVATALQIVRQYLITSFPERLDDQSAARNTPGHTEEHSDRHHRYYNPSLDEILTNPVPFDANKGANGALRGNGELGHRVAALGHDPIIGLVVGTCNIATSTLTTNKLESYHIRSRLYDVRGGKQALFDAFENRANTALVFEKSADKLINQGINGKIIIGASLGKEIVHLRSDIKSVHSLPLPVISMIDGKFASELASYGLDMANVLTVGKQATYSILINTIIAMIHGMLAPDDIAKDFYEVKTRKILLYSNAIASSSNLIYVGANAIAGNEAALKSLDIGGLMVTCYRVATDTKFIQSLKREFIENKFFDMIKDI